jgi:glutamate-1-semialdehyde 2,1-aminomutase
MAAGVAGLLPLRDPTFYRRLGETTEALASGLRAAAADAGVPVTLNGVTGMLTIFFTAEPVRTLADVESSDTQAFARFHAAMLSQGIYLPPSQFEAWMTSSVHSDEIIQKTLAAARTAMGSAAREGGGA